jgi:hypothetical protein
MMNRDFRGYWFVILSKAKNLSERFTERFLVRQGGFEMTGLEVALFRERKI